MPRTVIPFSTGTDESVDPKMLPKGALRSVKNLRLRRGAQLAPRFGFAALGNTHGAGTMVPSDLMEFDSRLMALGSFDEVQTAPTDLYSLVERTGQAWAASHQENAEAPQRRLPAVTNLRNLGRMPLGRGASTAVDMAMADGIAVVLQPQGARIAIQVIDTTGANGDVLISHRLIDGTHGKALGLANGSLFVACRNGGDVRLHRMIAGASVFTEITAPPAVAGSNPFDIAPHDTGFMLAISGSSSIQVQTFDSAGANVADFGIADSSSPEHIHVVQCGARLVCLYNSLGGSAVTVVTLSSAGAVVAGPTVLTGTDTPRPFGAASVRSGTDCALLFGVEVNGQHTVNGHAFDVDNHSATTDFPAHGQRWNGVKLMSKPLVISNSLGEDPLLFGAVLLDHFGNGSSVLCEFNPAELISATADRLVAVTGEGSGDFDDYLRLLSLDPVTGKGAWVRVAQEQDADTIAVGSVFDLAQLERRQSAVVNGELYITGGTPSMYDTRQVAEAGFTAGPNILAAAATTGGSLEEGSASIDALYLVAAVYEWTDSQGRLHRSEPSPVCKVNLGPGENAIDITVSGHMTMRENLGNSVTNTVRVVIFRSARDPNSILRRDQALVVPLSATVFGEQVSTTLTQPDSTLVEQGAIYTQGSTGIRSGPNPFDFPRSCSYIWPTTEKVWTGGLDDSRMVQESREAFPFEPVTWAANLGGVRGISERVLGVAALDGRRVVFTANSIYMVDGEGLDINGVGDLGTPTKLPSACGLAGGKDGWKSIVATPDGVMFHGVTGLLYMIPRGGGAPVSVGDPVQTTLEEFPNIAGAAYCQDDQTVVFACNNSSNTAAVLLVYDVSVRQWSVDDEPGTVLAVAHHQGKLIVLRGDRTIHRQSSDVVPLVFVSTEVVSGSLHPFGPGVEGQTDAVQLVVEYRGQCVIRAFLSKDDGLTESELSPKTLTGLEVGKTRVLVWHPDTMVGSRFRLRFSCTENQGPSEGVRYNYAVLHSTSSNTIEVVADEDIG